jgi:23S rRNA (adenine2503-C2)-methyltransferase
MSDIRTPQPKDIRDLSFDELVHYLKAIGEKPFRANQIFEWIYQRNSNSFDGMNNLSKPLRDQISRDLEIKSFALAKKEVSKDGTTKMLFDLEDHEKIETVVIPTATRTTVCVSTQAGCKFGCRFCASGIGGWKRNLTMAEILMQVIYAQQESAKFNKRLSHIVYMGIGEPLDNFDNLMRAIRVINDKKGMNIGARKITVSTCGVIPKIKQLAAEGLQIELAISLHGYDNESRNVLMPVNRKYPFDDLIQACREYIESTKRQITFEYIMIKDVTCSDKAISVLRQAFKGLICKMNLIPYNPVSEFDHKTPSRQEIMAFKNRLQIAGIHATVRTPRGKDINSACGQLRHAE